MSTDEKPLPAAATETVNELHQRVEAMVRRAERCVGSIRAGEANGRDTLTAMEAIAADGLRARPLLGRLVHLADRDATVRAWVDVREVVRTAVPPARVQERHGMTVLLDLLPSALPVHVDRAAIEHAILNLLRNAHEATRHLAGDDCALSISTVAAPDGSVQITVREVPCAEAKTGKRNGNGAGGSGVRDRSEHRLSIASSIVEEHGGTLRVVSDAGRFVAFELVLPGSTRTRSGA